MRYCITSIRMNPRHEVRPSPRQRALVERFYPGVWDRMGLTGPRHEPIPRVGASFLGQRQRLDPCTETG